MDWTLKILLTLMGGSLSASYCPKPFICVSSFITHNSAKDHFAIIIPILQMRKPRHESKVTCQDGTPSEWRSWDLKPGCGRHNLDPEALIGISSRLMRNQSGSLSLQRRKERSKQVRWLPQKQSGIWDVRVTFCLFPPPGLFLMRHSLRGRTARQELKSFPFCGTEHIRVIISLS